MDISRLPPEILDAVFEYLQEDEQALKACTLVCKDWVYLARHRLFANVTLNYNCVTRLLRAGSTVIPFIRHLRIRSHSSLWFWNVTFPLLTGFENSGIRSLSVLFLPWDHLTQTSRSTLVAQFTTIIYLSLDEVNVDKFSELLQIICSFPSLETLILGSVGWDSEDTPPSTLRAPCHLHALKLVGTGSRATPILKWLLSLETMPALHTFFLVYRSKSGWDDCLKILNTILQALGHSLQTFQLTRGAFCDGPIDLRHNTSLSFVQLQCTGKPPPPPKWIIQPLSQIGSTHMEKIVLRIHLFLSSHLERDYVDWGELDVMLTQPRFSSLRRVTIRVISNGAFSPDGWFDAHLPRCHARGILHVDKDYSEPLFPRLRPR